MSVKLYTPDSNVIVHQAKVDFRRRIVQRQVNLVQYDKSMPIIAVQLYSNGTEYVLPETANAYIRFGKRDHTYVYNECLGCDQTRTIVYFAITDQMTIFYGEHTPIIELRIGDTVAGSGSIPIWIDRNPIQNGDTESKSDLSVFEKAIEAAQKINVKLPTDLKATATNLSLLAGATKIGSGINLSGFEYDEATNTLKASGGGGASVSPCLNLMNMEDLTVRTSITEEEKTNLEKGLYNSVLYVDTSLGTAGAYSMYFPETAVFGGESLFFSKYNLSIDNATNSVAISSSSSYNLTIGEKSADGTYPITITKMTEATFGGGGGASVSPCLNLFDPETEGIRTSITEEEKNNLDKGLYNSVLFVDFSLGDNAITGVMFPQRLVGLDGEFMFSSYKAKPGAGEADDWSFLGASTYGLSIGEKTSDGNYPITIDKINDVKGIQTINAVLTVDQATQDITIQLDVTPSGDMFILSPTQSEESGIGNVLMVRQPDGNYVGFWSIAEDTVVCQVKPDGTGSAFYSPTNFLFRTMQETDGKVLTIESGVPRWLDPVSSLPAITSADVGKFLTVKSDQKTAWGSVPHGSPIEIVLDESKPYFNLGEYNKKIGVYLLSRPNNAILYEAKFDNDSATFTKILLYGSMKASAQNVDYLDVSGSLYGLNGNSTLAYIGSGIWQLQSEDNYKFLPYPYFQEASLCCSGGISGAIPSFTLYGSAIGKTSPDYIGLLPQVCKYCALRYDFKKTSSSTDTEKVTSAFFGSVSADNILTPTKITLIGIFDNGMGKAVLEKNASGVFESKTPIEYVEDVNAITYSKARYKHTVTLKTSAGAILWTQTLSNSKNTPVASYQDLHTLFGGELIAGYGEYAQLNLHGGTEETDKLIKADGTEVTLASLGAIVYSDDCFLPK